MCFADGGGEVPEVVIRDAFDFLQQQGCINMGVPAGEPDLVKQTAEQAEAFPTDDDIIRGLQDILKDADLQVCRSLHLSRDALLRSGMEVTHTHFRANMMLLQRLVVCNLAFSTLQPNWLSQVDSERHV